MFVLPVAAFGQSVGNVFVDLSPQPVAAASLGQVYKGTLSEKYGGGTVAVKVRTRHRHPPAQVTTVDSTTFLRYCAMVRARVVHCDPIHPRALATSAANLITCIAAARLALTA